MLLETAGRRPRSLAVNDDGGRGAATRGVVFMLRRDTPQGRLLTNCLRTSNGGGGETTLEAAHGSDTSPQRQLIFHEPYDQQELLGDSPYERLSLRDRTSAAKTARSCL